MNKPMMADREIEYLDGFFEKERPEMCLEWGSGHSTLWFTQHESIKKWVAIEHSLRWYKHVGSNKNEKVDLRLKDIDSYLDVDGLYDFILVDGMIRNMCLYRARKLLKENGVVFLHDSERNIYEEGVELYKNKEIIFDGKKFNYGAHQGLTKLWM